ncbi:MAG TPA: hypothetical protein VF624_11845, partial [Tepidisphaeraceae bacterium]
AVYPPTAEWLGRQILAFDRPSKGRQPPIDPRSNRRQIAQFRAQLARSAHLLTRDTSPQTRVEDARQ